MRVTASSPWLVLQGLRLLMNSGPQEAPSPERPQYVSSECVPSLNPSPYPHSPFRSVHLQVLEWCRAGNCVGLGDVFSYKKAPVYSTLKSQRVEFLPK